MAVVGSSSASVFSPRSEALSVPASASVQPGGGGGGGSGGAVSGERALKMRARRLEKMLIGAAPLLPSIGQRLLLCFEYLDIDRKGYFTLKDLAERGRLVFAQLSLPGHDNSFAIMDSFHHFDRHTGRVHLEDLGVGLIERLQGLASNDALLRTVAREIVPSGKKSNLDIIAMLRSGSLPSSFRHHFGPHVEVIVAELASITGGSSSNTHDALSLGGNNLSSVEYLSAGRFVEVLQRSIELACADICAVLHLPASVRVRLAEESLSGYHFFDGRSAAALQGAAVTAPGTTSQDRKYLLEKISTFSWQVKGSLIKNLSSGAVPVLSSEDAEATGGDVVTTDTEALTEGERERTDTRASSQLCDEMGEKMAQTEGRDGEVDDLKKERDAAGAPDQWDLDDVELFLLAQAREAISRFVYLTAAKSSARTGLSPVGGDLRAVADALGISLCDDGESTLKQIADINSIKVMSRYLPLSKEILFLEKASTDAVPKHDGFVDADPLSSNNLHGSVAVSFAVSPPPVALAVPPSAPAPPSSSSSSISPLAIRVPVAADQLYQLGSEAHAAEDMGGKGLGEVNYKLLLKFNEMQDRLLRTQIRLQVLEAKQTELATEKGDWEDEKEGAKSGGRDAAGVLEKGPGLDDVKDKDRARDSDGESDGSETASVVSSAEGSEQPGSSDAQSTGESCGSDSENDSESSFRSFASKGSMASRLSSSRPRRRRGRGKHGRGRRGRTDGYISANKHSRGREGGSTPGDETVSSVKSSDESSDSEGGAIDLQPEVLFDDILKGLAELEQLAVCTAHSERFLGTLLENDCALIPYTSTGLELTSTPIDVSKALSTAAPVGGDSLSGPARPRPAPVAAKDSVDLSAFEDLTRRVHSLLAEKRRMAHLHDNLQMKLAMSEERVAEVEMQLEQSRRDREESMNVSVEVQVLREKNARLSSEEQALFQMQQRNSELTQRLGEMQRELRELGDLGLRGIKDVSHQGRGLNSAGKINVENTSGSNGDVALISLAGLPSSNSGLSKSEQDLRAHLKQIADLSSQRDRLVKENQRLKLAAKQADQRMKAALQDHLALRQKLNQTEDDLAASKMQISNLMGEIDHERSLRGDRDALVKKSQELHVEVVELRGLVEESRLASVQLAKAKEDLASAEDQISLLEERLADITQEAELNSIGHNQVDNLRSMLELRSRENRDLVLQVQSLERRVQELQALETRYSDAADELVELKFKVEQIPPLLADLSRAKASVRATTRTLQEQDKTVSGLRRRCVELEAEAARLRQETRTMEELRSRVRASDADRDRYVQETREIPLLKAQLKKHQEDLKSLDASHRRVKKMIRQTAIVSGAAVGQQQQQQQVQMPSSSSSIGPNLGNYSLTGSNNSTAFDTAASLGQGTNSISSPSPPPASSSSPLYASSGSPPLVGPSAGMSNSVLLSSSLGPGPSVAGNPYFNLFGSP